MVTLYTSTGRFRFILSLVGELDAHSSRSLGIKNDTKRLFEQSTFRRAIWGEMSGLCESRKGCILDSTPSGLFFWPCCGEHLQKINPLRHPSHFVTRVLGANSRLRPRNEPEPGWTSLDRPMWTPVKSVIQEENASDMGSVAGVAGVGVVLPEQVAVWVA